LRSAPEHFHRINANVDISNIKGGTQVDVNTPHHDINELHRNLGWYIALAIAMMVLGVFSIFILRDSDFAAGGNYFSA
jgi:hypothetical protein